MHELQRVLNPEGNIVVISNSGMEKRSSLFTKASLSLNVKCNSFIVDSGNLVKLKDTAEAYNLSYNISSQTLNKNNQINLSGECNSLNNKASKFLITQDSVSFHNTGQFNSITQNTGSSQNTPPSNNPNSIEIKCYIYYINKNYDWREKCRKSFTMCLNLSLIHI